GRRQFGRRARLAGADAEPLPTTPGGCSRRRGAGPVRVPASRGSDGIGLQLPGAERLSHAAFPPPPERVIAWPNSPGRGRGNSFAPHCTWGPSASLDKLAEFRLPPDPSPAPLVRVARPATRRPEMGSHAERMYVPLLAAAIFAWAPAPVRAEVTTFKDEQEFVRVPQSGGPHRPPSSALTTS